MGKVSAPQPRLDMGNRDLGIKAGKRRRHCRGRVTLDENEVRSAVCKATTECPQQVSSRIRQRYADWFDVQFTISGESKRGQRRAADLAVLTAPTPGMALYQLVHGGQIVHIPDITADDVYRSGNTVRRR